MFGEKVIQFYRNMQTGFALPPGVEVMQPFSRPASAVVTETFYRRFYGDENPRTFIIGINPGRFGGGVTGIPFTDPVKLERYCGIANDFPKKTELSADFIYRVIESFGGAEAFYSKFYFTSISPLGFTREGVNMNYYDDPVLVKVLDDFMIRSMETQVDFGTNQLNCICLGSGKNLKQLQRLNERGHFFRNINVLDHPRFIMQYKRKSLDEYLLRYLSVLAQVQ
ncbi:MAG TPA: uracil-DNA glycosylase family protein [Sphingobacteriaceae bacterium]